MQATLCCQHHSSNYPLLRNKTVYIKSIIPRPSLISPIEACVFMTMFLWVSACSEGLLTPCGTRVVNVGLFLVGTIEFKISTLNGEV